ncbi:universal stress protein [Pontibacterium granulatum]|uniref:universal stress protein n=1 Tax=Pontibacterium granulatum TaxID=2036029 RepID=UPI00249CACFA|nr:universal stress protein [Pontibacterium granulatum]MDI3326735.1 universal stress protein [Pontibacterium granulatum]
MKLKKILFVVNRDFLILDDPAFEICTQLSLQSNAQIVILLVIDESDIPGYGIFIKTKNEDVKQELIDRMQRYLDSQLANYEDVPVTIKIRCGVKFIEIIKESVEGNFDIILKTQDINRQHLASLDLHLLRKAQTPIWILRNSAKSTSKDLYAAIDLNLESTKEGRALNDKIMATSKQLADKLDLEISILSCWKLNGEDSLRHNPFLKIKDSEIAEMITLEADRQSELMKQFLSKHGDFESFLIKGNVVESITNFVSISRPKALVMGTFARSGLSGYLIGNTAEDILLSIDCPVIAIKPEGFASPVL